MAQELVLIPKTKYERLLKLSEKTDHNEQNGGQLENKNEVSSILDDKSKENILKENKIIKDSKHENEIKKNMEEEKSRLYVDKPLSQMKFSIRKLSRGKIKDETTNGRKLARSHGKTKNIKSTRWINYTI